MDDNEDSGPIDTSAALVRKSHADPARQVKLWFAQEQFAAPDGLGDLDDLDDVDEPTTTNGSAKRAVCFRGGILPQL